MLLNISKLQTRVVLQGLLVLPLAKTLLASGAMMSYTCDAVLKQQVRVRLQASPSGFDMIDYQQL